MIHDPTVVDPGHRMGHPVEGAPEALRALTDKGHLVYIYTARLKTGESPVYLREWLEYFGMNAHVNAVLHKFPYDVLIDDKALQFTNWREVMEGLT